MTINKKKNKPIYNRFSSEKNNNLITYAKKQTNSIMREFNTSFDGIKIGSVKKRREKYGYNTINVKKTEHWYNHFFDAFFNPFSIVLIIISILTIIAPYIKDRVIDLSDWVSFSIIIFLVILSGVIKIFQERRSSKASEKLKSMIKTTAAIKRNGVIREIPLEEILPGDIIKLAAGDMIPADIRILSAKDLFIVQSSLTGESEPVEKFAIPITNDIKSALECNNLCFMGTSVSSGSAIGVVINTGKNTFFGSIAKMLNTKRAKSNFNKGITKVSWILIWTMLVMALVVFIIYGLKHRNDGNEAWLSGLTYTLAIAVGLTPEMLPMIVTINLAKEAFKLSKQDTIVKNINMIQTFGAMDVLCTDKTGTLTEDKIVLERHINLEGKDDNRVLTYAFLNSYYQTGLKNLIDLAIIEKADKVGIDDPIMGFNKIDEIPFDFQRRRMSVIIQDKQNQRQLITKGAFEEIIAICSHAEYQGKVVVLDDKLKQHARKIAKSLNNDGMRVIAIAVNNENLPTDHAFNVNDEKNMCLIGFVALLDPPKESAIAAIKELKNHGVMVKILTGDNELVSKYVCKSVGIDEHNVLLGSDIENMSDEKLRETVMSINIFAKLSPEQKSRIVSAIKTNKHIVGYMGDGINDAAAMRAADVGISVDTAVDIAKESADIILLKKDLRILVKSVVEGRKTFCNIVKYIKTTISSNFGNMLSLLVATCWLPWEPMFPLHILIMNMIYDFSQYTIPWDNVDESYIKLPKKWDPKSIFKFMVIIGPVSSIFDIASFLIMYYGFDWNSNNELHQMLFSSGWFLESLLTQIIVIYVLRTEKMPFIQSNPSTPVNLALGLIVLVGFMLVLIPGLETAKYSSLTQSVLSRWWILISFGMAFTYLWTAQIIKICYKRIYHEWL